MEARYFQGAPARRPSVISSILTACYVALILSSFPATEIKAQFGHQTKHVANSPNFIVFASSPQWAAQVAEVAEQNRRELAKYWLGRELPTWSERCPIHVTASSNMPASGETRFSPIVAGVGNWLMKVNGTPERILDSVLPHEISHTILATHFAKYAQQGRFVPRWADEGACTTVEHESEKRKHRKFLREFLQNGRGLAFNQMFSLKEYPNDILPLYAQGHSAVQFLIDQSDPKSFVRFLEQGMETGAWESALRDHYTYKTIGEFQTLWNQWLSDGSPTNLISYAPKLDRTRNVAVLASNQGGIAQGGQLQLASSVAEQPSNLPAGDPLALNTSVPNSSSSSWYSRRFQALHASSGSNPKVVEPLTGGMQSMPASIPLEQAMAGSVMPPVYSSQGMSRPQPIQRPQVQVLEMGAPSSTGARQALPIQALPQSGYQSTSQPADYRMVPIYR